MERNEQKNKQKRGLTRRRILFFIPLGVGGLALLSRIRLPFKIKSRLSGRIADHWEVIEKDRQ